MPRTPVDRVQQDREQAEEGDERDLLHVADVVQQDDRDRQQRGRRHRPPVLDVRHRQLRAQRESPIGIPSATPATTAIPKPRPIRTRLGTTCVVNCENSHMSWNSTRIVDSRGKLGLSACTVQACQATRIASGTSDLRADRDRVVEPPVHARAPLRRMPAQHAALERRPSRSGSRARGSRWRSRARTAGRSGRTTARSSSPGRGRASP